MRITVKLDEAAAVAARNLARRERLSLSEAISELIRPRDAQPLRGRFALLPQRDEAVTPEHVRALMDRTGI